MRLFIPFLFSIILTQLNFATAAGKRPPLPPLETVSHVNLEQYVESPWFEIARLDQFYEKDCVGVTALYALRPDGKIDVTNSCHKKTCTGKYSDAKGIGRVVDTTTNSKLKVSFFWPFEGDYWILELDENYAYAVVGAPDRKTFWILSRSSTMPEEQINSILERFQAKGFDFKTLVRTVPCK